MPSIVLAHILIWFLALGQGSEVYLTLTTGCLGVALQPSAAHINMTKFKKNFLTNSRSLYAITHTYTNWRGIIFFDNSFLSNHKRTVLFGVLNGDLTRNNSYLPDGEVKPDQGGVSSSVRPSHCTSLGLTSAIATSVVTRPYNFW